MVRFARKTLWVILGLLLATAALGQSGELPPGEWDTIRGGGVTVYHESQDQDAAKGLLELFGEHKQKISDNLGLAAPSGIRVFIAPNEGRFRYLTRGLPEWTGGVAYPRQKIIVLKAPRLYQGGTQFAVTALHELVHIITDHDGPSNLPRWLSEGLAMYLSGETMYKQRTPLARAVVMGKTHTLNGIEDLLRLGPGQARVAYLQSINFVEFLVDRYGWGALAQLLEGYSEGMDEDELFVRVTGNDLFTVEAAWHQHLRKSYHWWRLFEWVNIDTILWSSAALLVMFVGIATLVRRRMRLHGGDDGDEDDPVESFYMYEDTIPPDWYMDDDDEDPYYR